jgi:hypothetical protein
VHGWDERKGVWGIGAGSSGGAARFAGMRSGRVV